MLDSLDPRVAARLITGLSQSGQPPRLGASLLNVGTDRLLAALRRDYLDGYLRAEDGQDGGGACKWVEADHGNGKTQFLRCVQEQAWQAGYACAFVELSQDECPLDRPDLVYAAVGRSLQARPCTLSEAERTRGVDQALPILLDRKFPGVLSSPADDPLRAEALAWVRGPLAELPVESSAVRRAVVALLSARLRGEGIEARIAGLYLRGEPVLSADLETIGVCERLEPANGFRFLRSLCQLVQRSGLATGTALLFDEARRSLSLMASAAQKVACENLLSILNRCNSGELPGTLFLYAVMPEFFTDFATHYPALQQRCGPATRINLNRLPQVEERALLVAIGERIGALARQAFDDYPLARKVIRSNLELLAAAALRHTLGSGARRLLVKSWVQVLLAARGHRMRPLTAEQADAIVAGTADLADPQSAVAAAAS